MAYSFNGKFGLQIFVELVQCCTSGVNAAVRPNCSIFELMMPQKCNPLFNRLAKVNWLFVKKSGLRLEFDGTRM